MNLCALTIREAHDLLIKKEISSVELTSACLENIRKTNNLLNSFITVCEKSSLEEAKSSDKRIRENNNVTIITGIPIALKDILITKGIKTTCGSKILSNFNPPYNGTVVQKIIDAGGVIIGKTNMDEFAMGSSSETSNFGPVKNPWDLNRIPGGSSGGSAVSIAADQSIAAIGTDTGGSIRLPASFCNIIGLKPTYGRVSRYGVVAFASSLDQVGPMTKDVYDCASLLSIIGCYDSKDSTSINAETPKYHEKLEQSKNYLKNLKVGIPKEYFNQEGMESDVAGSLKKVIDLFSNNGAQIKEISLPHARYGIQVYYVICTAEASSNLARFDGVKYGFRSEEYKDLIEMYINSRTIGFGDEVKRRVMLGTFVLSSGYYEAYYRKAQEVRTLIKKDFSDAFLKCDVILAPTSPTCAFKLGEKTNDPLTMYLSDIYTVTANLAGIPSLALPCGFSKHNLPIGMQLMGNYLNEDLLFKVGYYYEQLTNWHTQKPAF
jgi:aspartyl-tRNA(Asn)/glutamyl-tRNA(Gln) amidotransferase subunit A